MILYFSGTGNSRYAAELISRVTGDELVSMNEMIQMKNRSALVSEKPLVFVTPVYAGRIPRIVDAYIRKTPFKGSTNAYFVATCAETPWIAGSYIEKLCRKKGFQLLGFNSVVMPQNYILHSEIKTIDENESIVLAATPKIKRIAETIRDGKALSKEEPGKALMSKILNPLMYALMINANGFCATDACNGCGQCVKKCPLNNITVENGKPRWGKDCTHCMACIGGCPEKAIENGKQTVGRNRYYNANTPEL